MCFFIIVLLPNLEFVRVSAKRKLSFGEMDLRVRANRTQSDLEYHCFMKHPRFGEVITHLKIKALSTKEHHSLCATGLS